MHSYNGRERSGALGAIHNCFQGDIAVAEFDRLRTASFRDPASKQEHQSEGQSKQSGAVGHMRVPVWFARLYNTNFGNENSEGSCQRRRKEPVRRSKPPRTQWIGLVAC